MRQVVVVFALMLLQGCSPSPGRLDALAAKGQVQDDAPVKASAEITIHASPEKVWSILSGIRDWPKWQSSVSAVQVNGPLAAGTVFVWTNGSTKIASRIALAEPGRRIAWTGTAFDAHAVHVWTLEALPDGSTRVMTSESMDGFMLGRLYSSEDLRESLTGWVAALKSRSEN